MQGDGGNDRLVSHQWDFASAGSLAGASGWTCPHILELDQVERVYRRIWIDGWRAVRVEQLRGPERQQVLAAAAPAQVTAARRQIDG